MWLWNIWIADPSETPWKKLVGVGGVNKKKILRNGKLKGGMHILKYGIALFFSFTLLLHSFSSSLLLLFYSFHSLLLLFPFLSHTSPQPPPYQYGGNARMCEAVVARVLLPVLRALDFLSSMHIMHRGSARSGKKDIVEPKIYLFFFDFWERE